MSHEMPSTSTATNQAPRSFFFIKALRAVRDHVADDGAVGRIFNSSIYTTLQDVASIWLVVEWPLWGVEHYFGHLFISDPTARMMRMLFHSPDDISPLGKALASELVRQFTSMVLIWKLIECVLRWLFAWLEDYVSEPYEIAQREYEEALQQEGEEAPHQGGSPRRPLGSIVNSRPFWYLGKLVVAWMLFTTVSTIGHDLFDAVEEATNAAPELTPAQLAYFNPYRNIRPEQERTARECTNFSFPRISDFKLLRHSFSGILCACTEEPHSNDVTR